MEFTYYGDLLGLSGYYKLNPQIAKEKLNKFYNIKFRLLSSYCEGNRVKVVMFSDSLLVYGSGDIELLSDLQKLYIELISEGLLLRGAIVKG